MVTACFKCSEEKLESVLGTITNGPSPKGEEGGGGGGGGSGVGVGGGGGGMRESRSKRKNSTGALKKKVLINESATVKLVDGGSPNRWKDNCRSQEEVSTL